MLSTWPFVKKPSNCCINRCLLRSYVTSRTIPQKTLHKSASKPVISSFYRGFTPLHLNGRLNAQVESDIVGYTTIEVTKEWTLMGVNFTGLDNPSTEEIPILSLISGNFSAGDQIQIPKINGADVTEWNPAIGKWCTISRGKVTEKEATYTIAAGQGFWLKSTTASLTSPLNVQISGKVYDGDSLTVALGQQYTIFSPISPTEIEVNSEELVWESLHVHVSITL